MTIPCKAGDPRRATSAATLILTTVALSWPAAAATPGAVAAVNARKANYKEIGGAFKPSHDKYRQAD